MRFFLGVLINQKYLYEMTNFYDDPMDDSGNYHYGHL